MWSTIVAVLGTLAGGALAGLTQRSTERRARDVVHRQTVTDAVSELLAAIVRYRELYWLSIAARRSGEGETRDDRSARYAARSAITVARDRVGLLVTEPVLLEAAEAAAWSAIELSDVELSAVTAGRFEEAVEEHLEASRERSRDAHTALRRAATAYVHQRVPTPRRERS
ncbi:hypothetical protein [Streptomyces murinus]|uniref:hypothetical protein n=1 Tax=Streptomyces murinus TaxID=33900 RepID=UPI002E14B45B|nr:hypothetical protein OG516_19460 [Streptomyces murinus]